METVNTSGLRQKINKPDFINDTLREQLLQFSKDFKTSWLSLGQNLYSVWRDKIYHTWGYEKFEDYTEEELGLKKELSLKLLKTYFFLEQEEPQFLTEGFDDARKVGTIPNYDAINVLRLAKNNKELTKADYIRIKKDIFEEGKDASEIRKDLTALMRERKAVDPDEERQLRNEAAIRRLLNAIRSFQKDMDSLKLVPQELVHEAEDLMKKLEAEIP